MYIVFQQWVTELELSIANIFILIHSLFKLMSPCSPIIISMFGHCFTLIILLCRPCTEISLNISERLLHKCCSFIQVFWPRNGRKIYNLLVLFVKSKLVLTITYKWFSYLVINNANIYISVFHLEFFIQFLFPC